MAMMNSASSARHVRPRLVSFSAFQGSHPRILAKETDIQINCIRIVICTS